ncbi:MAG: glycosyltransferase family 39 protein [Alphaproteobacteria bacterium]|jgi:hypothetical protein|nr:glycosyltransferase family 39 protein [Alphaproteobacteria bacterium]MDP7468106.1 glycosyltransferase family 39 protein [Alphaproteobacteria bacterium]
MNDSNDNTDQGQSTSALTTDQGTSTLTTGKWPLDASGSGFAFLALCYVSFFFALRLVLSSTVGTDDVEQVIFAQDWALRYNPSQPPFYTWILYSLFKIFGVGLPALGLLRYSLMFTALVFSFLCARRLIPNRRLATVAAFSPLLIYYVGWGWHQGFTHTSLLIPACFATFHAFLMVLDTGRARDYLWLGCALALGLNAKYGFALFTVALVLAAITDEQSRKRVLNPFVGLSLAVAAALVLPSLAGMGMSLDSYGDVYHRTMEMESPEGYAEQVAVGLGRLALSTVSFLFPLWIFCLIFFPQGLRRQALPDAPAGSTEECWRRISGRVLGRFLMIIFALAVLGVLVAGISYFKARWMPPILILAPLYYFWRVGLASESGENLQKSIRCFAITLVAVPVLVTAFWSAQRTIGDPLCNKCRLGDPYPEIAESISAAGFTGGTILSQDEHIGGNLRMRFTDARVVNLHYGYYIPPLKEGKNDGPSGGQCLMAWKAEDPSNLSPPPELVRFLNQRLGHDAQIDHPPQMAAGINTASGRSLRIGFVILEGAGTCR